MTLLGITGLINFITSFALALFVILNNPRGNQARTYFLLNSSVALYSFGYFFWQFATNDISALFWFRFLTVGIILINPTYLHFVFAFLNKTKSYLAPLTIIYVVNFVFIILNFSLLLYTRVEPRFGLGYWPEPTALFHLYLFFWSFQCFWGFYQLLKGYYEITGIKREQVRYFILAAAVGFLGGATNWLVWYKIPFPPYLNILIAVYIAITTYAITKHRLMDISVVISRTVAEILTILFLGVIYVGLVWLYRTFISASIDLIFITWTILYGILVGQTYQLIRLKIQTTSNKLFLRGRYDYYQALAGAGEQITKTLSMENILKTLCQTFTDVMEVANPRIYIGDEETMPFSDCQSITQKENDLIIPCRLEGRLIAVIVLGKKLSEDPYTTEDLRLLKALASQAAVAIDHTRTYEQVKNDFDANQKKLYDTERLLARSEKIASMAGLIQEYNHEIRTPLAIMSSKILTLPDDPKEMADFKGLKEYLLNQIKRASDIVDSTLRLSEPKEKKELKLNLNNIIEEALAMYHPLGVSLVKELKPLPAMIGDPDDLKLVFINLLKNAREAISGQGRITIKTFPFNDAGQVKIAAEIADTGRGIARGNMEKIFEPFFSTHVTRGRGLGLSIVFRIIREHLGTIEVKSEPGQGAAFTIKLPAAD